MGVLYCRTFFWKLFFRGAFSLVTFLGVFIREFTAKKLFVSLFRVKLFTCGFFSLTQGLQWNFSTESFLVQHFFLLVFYLHFCGAFRCQLFIFIFVRSSFHGCSLLQELFPETFFRGAFSLVIFLGAFIREFTAKKLLWACFKWSFLLVSFFCWHKDCRMSCQLKMCTMSKCFAKTNDETCKFIEY